MMVRKKSEKLKNLGKTQRTHLKHLKMSKNNSRSYYWESLGVFESFMDQINDYLFPGELIKDYQMVDFSDFLTLS